MQRQKRKKHQKPEEGRYASKQQRKSILKRDGYQCRYCGAPVTDKTANMDHVIPWRAGGRTIGRNLVTCCRPCNKWKGNRRNIRPLAIGEKGPMSVPQAQQYLQELEDAWIAAVANSV